MRSERNDRKHSAEMGIDDPDIDQIWWEIFMFRRAPQKTNLFPFVHETLQYLNGNYKLYILTNGFAEIQVQKINNCGLQAVFLKIVYG